MAQVLECVDGVHGAVAVRVSRRCSQRLPVRREVVVGTGDEHRHVGTVSVHDVDAVLTVSEARLKTMRVPPGDQEGRVVAAEFGQSRDVGAVGVHCIVLSALSRVR